MTKQINDSIKFILLFFLYGDFVTKVRAAMNYMNVVVYDISSILFYHVYSSIAKRVAYFNSHPPKTLQHTTHPNLPNHKKKKREVTSVVFDYFFFSFCYRHFRSMQYFHICSLSISFLFSTRLLQSELRQRKERILAILLRIK